MDLDDQYRGLNWTAFCHSPNVTITIFKTFNYASSISSILAFFPTLALLLVIFFYHSYSSILHRLFIYFTLSILGFILASAGDLQLQFDLSDRYCRWTGYFKMTIHMISLLFSSEICAYLLCKMYYQVRHQKKLPQLGKNKTIILELGIVGATVLPPPLLLLLAKDKFGLSSTVCWVQLFKSNSCDIILNSTNSLVLSLVLIKGSFYIFNFLAYSILIVLFCRLAHKTELARKQYFSTARRTVILVLLLIGTTGTDLTALFFLCTLSIGIAACTVIGLESFSLLFTIPWCSVCSQ